MNQRPAWGQQEGVVKEAGRLARLHRPEPRLPLSLRVVVPQQKHPREDGGAVELLLGVITLS